MNSTDEALLRLASSLRNLRQARGYTGQALAETLGWTQPRISKIENGKQLPTEADVEAFARACGAGEETVEQLLSALAEARIQHRAWRHRLRGGQAQTQRDYDKLARQATVIRNADASVIPGLLQTPGYARIQAMQGVLLHDQDPGQVDTTVTARMQRQTVLYDTSKRFEFVTTEAALWSRWCPPPEMRNQLGRLATVGIEQDHIWFGIIPFAVTANPPLVPQGGFVMFDDEVYVEGYEGETTYRGDDAVAKFSKVMQMLREEAVTGEQAQELIGRAARELRKTDE